MEEKFCPMCNHFPICINHSAKAREAEIWNTPEKFEAFYRSTAQSCDYWREDAQLKDQIESHRLLKRIINDVEQGKIVAVRNGIGPVDIQGTFDNENQILVPSGENHLIYLKAVAIPKPPA